MRQLKSYHLWWPVYRFLIISGQFYEIICYDRASTNQQSLDVLIQALKNAGVKNFRIYFDKKQ